MYTLGAILLLAAVVGAVTAVVDSVLGLVKVKDTIHKLPVIGAHWGLLVAIGTMWVLESAGHVGYPAGGWGIAASEEWINVVVNGAILYAAIPLKDAVINMVNKGLRA